MLSPTSVSVGFAYLLLVTCVLGQQFRATITGRVTHASGPCVARAALVVGNVGMNEQVKTTTDRDGNHTVEAGSLEQSVTVTADVPSHGRPFANGTFNTCNTPISGAPNTDANSRLFGYVTPRPTNFPRHIQFGFK